MLTDATTARSVSTIPRAAARLSLAAAATFVVLLAGLHLLKPELDPAWRFISEYAIGNLGWLMALAFLSLAVSYTALVVALRPHIRTIAGRLGLALLLVSAVGMAIAGRFPTDPITSSRDALTTTGKLHELGALPDLTPFAALLLNWSLLRYSPAWASARRALLVTAGLPLIGLISFIAAVALMLPPDGTFGPAVLVGWPNRLLIGTYCVWVGTIAWQAARVEPPPARQAPTPR